jgi:hypothetical protein
MRIKIELPQPVKGVFGKLIVNLMMKDEMIPH